MQKIENSFEMIQSRVSRHLKILKEGGFLKVERRGRWTYYSIRVPRGINIKINKNTQ